MLGACRSLVRVRHGVWLSKVDAGRRLAADGRRADPTDDGAAADPVGGGAADLIERSIAARAGGPPPSGPEARAFQQGVLDEISR